MMNEIKESIIVKFFENACTPVAKEAGERLADVINLVCTPILMLRKYRDVKMQKIFLNLEKKLNTIPEDKIQTPPLNIVGPVIDNIAKYYYDKDDLCEMFTNLIAASMNEDIESKVHPAFIEIIKQLNYVDMRILNSNYLFNYNNLKCRKQEEFARCIRPIVDIVYISKTTKDIVSIIDKNFIKIKDYFPKMKPDKFKYSLTNLTRLNLISIDNSYGVNKAESFYKEFDTKHLEVLELFKNDTIYNSEDIEPAYIKKIISLTDFGFDFISTCIQF